MLVHQFNLNALVAFSANSYQGTVLEEVDVAESLVLKALVLLFAVLTEILWVSRFVRLLGGLLFCGGWRLCGLFLLNFLPWWQRFCVFVCLLGLELFDIVFDGGFFRGHDTGTVIYASLRVLIFRCSFKLFVLCEIPFRLFVVIALIRQLVLN